MATWQMRRRAARHYHSLIVEPGAPTYPPSNGGPAFLLPFCFGPYTACGSRWGGHRSATSIVRSAGPSNERDFFYPFGRCGLAPPPELASSSGRSGNAHT
jgi:hypothetical protein